jgi:hypothetical protein
MTLTRLKLGQIDLRDLESSELASANSVGNALSNLSTVGATSNTLMGVVNGNVSVAVDTLQDNVDAQSSSLGTVSNNIDSEASIFTSYATYANSTFVTQSHVDSEISNLVAGAGASLDTLNELAAALGDDANAAVTLTSTIGTVSANVSGYISDADTVSSNVDTYAVYANTQIGSGGAGTFAANGESVSNSLVYFEGGDGISLTTNTTSQTITLSMEMSNASTQEISMNGASNIITLTKSAANANMLLVFYNGLAQRPSEYTISGTTLTLSNSKPIIAGSNVEVRHFDFFPVTGISSGASSGTNTQGSISGYTSGGGVTIDKFPFSTDANATDVGDLLTAGAYRSGQSSPVSGYTTGGGSPAATRNMIQKFPFAVDSNATDVGDLTQARQELAGQSSSENGYASGGRAPTPQGNQPQLSTIDKFSFASDANATYVGALTQAVRDGSGQSSTDYGYMSGAIITVPDGESRTDTIQKFPFASDANATDVGELTRDEWAHAGQQSSTNGYTSGGGSGAVNVIEKFPFSSDTNATDVGDLTQARQYVVGQSSTTFGYTSGGGYSPVVDTIDKFPFSSDADATDVGELTVARYGGAGQQV